MTLPRARSSAARSRVYRNGNLEHVAFPLGGIGAGMVCLEGAAAFSHVSLRHRPDVFHEPLMFAAVCVKGEGSNVARVLEGPVPTRKVFWKPGGGNGAGMASGLGLPRLERASFEHAFPFATVKLGDPSLPLRVEVTGWSPFNPGDADASSLPVAGVEYRLVNTSDRPLELVFSFHASNFMRAGTRVPGDTPSPVSDTAVNVTERGFELHCKPTEKDAWREGSFSVELDDPELEVDAAWFRGGWFDPLTMLWRAIESGQAIGKPPHAEGEPGGGGSVYLPLRLEPGKARTVSVRMSWYVPHSEVRAGSDPQGVGGAEERYRPWYASRFANAGEVRDYWHQNYAALRRRSRAFSKCFRDTTLPPEAVEAVEANLTILKSPTCLRDHAGRFWAWEGCGDTWGCCHGTCTHVWNYAQSLPHLFPSLERSLRETEYEVSQDERGHQAFRASLPIRPPTHDFHAAADGQLGGLVKLYRDWRISGDTAWLKRLWPAASRSLQYAIEVWDPGREGVLAEPHHNTYDIEFWGPNGMCSSFYLAALLAATRMGRACGDDVTAFEDLLAKGRRYLEDRLFNGEYFEQEIRWKGLRAGDPLEASKHAMSTSYTPEARAILEREGPKYQYGTGCLSDGILGAWLAAVCGLDEPVVDPAKVRSHVEAVYRHNFKRDLFAHANTQRPGYALGDEGGLIVLTWPRGGRNELPMTYADEVFTGIEYQVASHLILFGRIEEGLEIVRTARARYDGRVRNPFNEYECGHWYARAMSSYALLEALSGVRYDAVEKTLRVRPRVAGDMRCFLATASGFGTVSVKGGEVSVEVVEGDIPVERVEYTAL